MKDGVRKQSEAVFRKRDAGASGNALPHRSTNAIKLRKAPKGRIDTAQANGLGIQDKKYHKP
jgi:hypothetical protein